MSDRKNPFRHSDNHSASWMLTFADLLSLLLTFFVLLFSMSTIQFDQWKSVVRTMSDQFNPKRVAVDPQPHSTPQSLLKEKVPGLNQAYLTALLSRTLSQDPILKDAIVHRVRDDVVISVPASFLFGDKDAVPTPDGVQALKQLAGTLVQVRNRLLIAGHTDDRAVRDRMFRSNWELSLARTRTVAGIMADAGYREPITALGYADTRFFELGAELGSARRNQLAERIDILIINEKRERGPYDIF